MKVRTWRADNTVRRPGVHKVRLRGKVRAGIDVMITRSNDVGVAMITVEQAIDPADSRGSTSYAQRATLAEVSLRVGNDQGPCHDHSSLVDPAIASPMLLAAPDSTLGLFW